MSANDVHPTLSEYLTDDEREALIDALRANRNNESGRRLRLLATVERIVRAHRAAALADEGGDRGVTCPGCGAPHDPEQCRREGSTCCDCCHDIIDAGLWSE